MVDYSQSITPSPVLQTLIIDKDIDILASNAMFESSKFEKYATKSSVHIPE